MYRLFLGLLSIVFTIFLIIKIPVIFIIALIVMFIGNMYVEFKEIDEFRWSKIIFYIIERPIILLDAVVAIFLIKLVIWLVK